MVFCFISDYGRGSHLEIWLKLKNVVNFKQKIYPGSWAKYEKVILGTLKLLPPEFRLDSLEKDYKAMQNIKLTKFKWYQWTR